MVSSKLRFHKMNGLGNEILVVDARGTNAGFTAEMIRTLAHRPKTHFDQLMALFDAKTNGTAAFVRIFNADGSEVSACGNGARCVGWILAQDISDQEAGTQDSGHQNIKIETQAGLLSIAVDTMVRISIDMGEPCFDWQDIPLAEAFHNTRGIELQIGPIDDPVLHSPSVVNVGNPHAIFWVDDVNAYDLASFGPLLENHPVFPERANISLANVTSREAVTIRTWERGAGLTKACGSAACATAVCGMRKRLLDRTVTVTVPGGDLIIEWTSQNRIRMTGPVELESEGQLSLEGIQCVKS